MMAKSKTDWMAELANMCIDKKHLEPQLFILRSGRKIKSKLFRYGNGQVHGDTVDGKSFSFAIGNLAKVEALSGTEAVENKKGRKTTGRPRGRTVVGQIIDTTEKGSTFENIINVGRAHLPR